MSETTADCGVRRLPEALRTGRLGAFRYLLAAHLPPGDIRSAIEAIEAGAASGERLGPRRSAFVHELPTAGRVVIKEYLRGGMVRHLVRRLHLRRPVPTRPARELEMLRRAQTAGANVPEPLLGLEVGAVAYRAWLVTRLVPGGRLASEVCLGLDPDGLRLLGAAVARQVRLLLAGRILHRDLHPGNVLLDEDQAPVLLDFDRAVLIGAGGRWAIGRYVWRWRRSVERHGLPLLLAEAFEAELVEG